MRFCKYINTFEKSLQVEPWDICHTHKPSRLHRAFLVDGFTPNYPSNTYSPT